MKHPSFVFACMRTPPSSPVGCKEFVRRRVLTHVTIGDSQKSTFVATANGRWSLGMPQRSVYKPAGRADRPKSKSQVIGLHMHEANRLSRISDRYSVQQTGRRWASPMKMSTTQVNR